MDIEKIFSDLESSKTQECDESKKKLVELFVQYKEQWPVHCMMDYFLKTGSVRIIEVLVKVQSPHDSYIFDRLTEWLKTPTYRVQALNLFSFVVRKHPTWLFKVERHRLIKDIIKLLQTEKEIVPLMSALLCIITLLPIIPSLVPHFLSDLFDVFGHLASWNCQNPNRLSEDKLVHLQLGLQMLFHRLYGMYPCNFVSYLSDFIKKEKVAIFHHTIKPLLETVRVHPMLLTATAESEISAARWKEMEPHDVVIECTRLSLPVMHQDISFDQTQQMSTLQDLCYGSGIRGTPNFTASIRDSCSTTTMTKTTSSVSYRTGPVQRFDCGGGSNKPDMSKAIIWSPYNEITASGPIPLTPTPSYGLPLTGTAMAPTNMNTLQFNQLAGITGSSPPEAAVEATPETTPMKDVKDLKQSVVPTMLNPHAVRAIFVSSQPSSPLRKEQNQFNFPEPSVSAADASRTTATTVMEREISTRWTTSTSVTTSYDRKIHQIMQDRKNNVPTMPDVNAPVELPSEATISMNTDIDARALSPRSTNSTPTPLTLVTSSSHTPTPAEPTSADHIKEFCDDCNETERSMCTAGGLHIPTNRSMQLLAKGIKRRQRMASYCCNEESRCDGSNGTGKAGTNQMAEDDVRVRRTKSCSSICFVKRDSRDGWWGTGYDVPVTEHRLQKSGKMLSIAKATKNSVAIAPTYVNASAQTIQIMAQHYENLLLQMIVENNEWSMAYERALVSPQKLLDQFVLHSTMRPSSSVDSGGRLDQEHTQLLCLQLQYERYRREIHAERNRRLMGRSRDKRSLEMERDRLREQLKNFMAKNKELTQEIDKLRKASIDHERMCAEKLNTLMASHQDELELNRCLRQANENLQTRLNAEVSINRKGINYELEALRGEILNLSTELQQAQEQVEIGMQCKLELARLEGEFIVMGEVQIKCRDRLADMDSYKARCDELQMQQDSYNIEMKDLKRSMEEKASQLDSARHKLIDLQAQLVNNEKVITEQKRLLRTVKDEYEEKFRSLNKKYEVQKTIIIQMEEKIVSLHRLQSADTDKMDHNSSLSASLASSESLSASLRSTATELRNLQQLIDIPIQEASAATNIINDGKHLPALDLASSASTATLSGGLSMAAALNILPTAATSSASVTALHYDLDTAPSTSHAHIQAHQHPHLHIQQQQQEQQLQQLQHHKR